MKLKITIEGPRVHDVGYKHFLMNQAIACGIRMFEAYSIEGENGQQVVIKVDGGDGEIEAFRELARSKRPVKAIVSEIATNDYEGKVMGMERYAQILVTIQLGKAIPIFMEMNEDIKSIKENLKELKWGMNEMVGEVKEMNSYVKNLTGM